jgi:hypothetical protein
MSWDEYCEEPDMVQLPCKVCGRPVELTPDKAAEYEAKKDGPLCLEDALKANPEKF